MREARSVVRHGLRGVIAIDGPSGTGKSTVARRLAADLDAGYLDSGAMYRAVTLAALRAGIPLADAAKVLPGLRLTMSTDPAVRFVLLGDEDVADEIRGPEVTVAVSPVSAVPAVREHLLVLQRELIERELERTGGIVVEGRDIGSVVWPQAEVKVYLTADAAARAHRRTAEHAHLGDAVATRAQLLERDRIDSGRATAPLTMAEGAVHLDTTDLTLEEVVEHIVALVETAGSRSR
jgi:CMP/dCMP kinase